MGASFFHESHFQGLLERVRDRGRLKCAQKVAEQVSRLFKASPEQNCDEAVSRDIVDEFDIGTMPPSLPRTGTESSESGIVLCDSPQSCATTLPLLNTSSVDDSRTGNICAKLCSLLKIQLLKAHEDVMKRYSNTCKVDVGELNISPSSSEKEDLSRIDGSGLTSASENQTMDGNVPEEKEPDSVPALVHTGSKYQ